MADSQLHQTVSTAELNERIKMESEWQISLLTSKAAAMSFAQANQAHDHFRISQSGNRSQFAPNRREGLHWRGRRASCSEVAKPSRNPDKHIYAGNWQAARESELEAGSRTAPLTVERQ